MSNGPIEEINEMLEDIWQQIKSNEAALETGEPFQTDGLEFKVKTVCKEVTSLPREDAITFEPELNKMIEFLTDLSKRMQERQDALKGEASELNQRERAMNAYAKHAQKMPKKPSSTNNDPQNNT